jgi:hypothetical protein
VRERIGAFEERAAALAEDERPAAQRLAELEVLDPANRILGLKICDPAMGSGHFLVSLVDWMADQVLAAMPEASAAVPWSLEPYVSPLAFDIARVRKTILAQAREHGWPDVERHLDDKHIVRRMILKRCVYGVDLNPMAVELAKVALWLHSFTVGAPLSFLDHHLREGNSVMGAWVGPTVERLRDRGAMFNLGQITTVENVADEMDRIERRPDNDVMEVQTSKQEFKAVEDATKPVAEFFSLLEAEELLGVFEAAPKKAPNLEKLSAAGKDEKALAKARADVAAFERAAAFNVLLEGTFGDPIKISAGEVVLAPSPETLMAAPVDEDGLPLPDEQFALLGSWSDLRTRVCRRARARGARRRSPAPVPALGDRLPECVVEPPHV